MCCDDKELRKMVILIYQFMIVKVSYPKVKTSGYPMSGSRADFCRIINILNWQILR